MELIVVVLVISILAAIGAYAYTRTVETAKDFAAEQAVLTLGTETYHPDMTAGAFAADGSSLVTALRRVFYFCLLAAR